jgi:hypothetical protein
VDDKVTLRLLDTDCEGTYGWLFIRIVSNDVFGISDAEPSDNATENEIIINY